MSLQVIFLEPDDDIETATRVELQVPPTPALLRTALGDGPIDIVPRFNQIVLDGELRRCVVLYQKSSECLQINHEANRLWEASVGNKITGEPLVGPVVIFIDSYEHL